MLRTGLPSWSLATKHGLSLLPLSMVRGARYQAYDSGLYPGDVSAARAWYQTFQQDNLPRGTTVYSRSSGAGGQHVNKTESKATTSWSLEELSATLPKVLHSKLCSSAHYSKGNNTVSFQAQTSRSRNANAEENRRKLFDEIVRLYKETVPGEADPTKAKKHEAVEKSFHESRIRSKKAHGTKKSFRNGGGDY